MPDLNYILLFIACVSPVVLLARTRRSTRSWRLPAVAVLIVTATAYAIAPQQAGFVGSGAWFALLFLPIVALRKAARLSAEERFGAAQQLVRLASIVHPAKQVRAQRVLLSARAFAQRGDIATADRMLSTIATSETMVGRRAIAQRLRIHEDWEGLLAWCRANVPRVGLGEDPGLLLLYFRALGELGLRDELVLQFAGRAPALQASPLHHTTFLYALLMVFAFCGRTSAVSELLKKGLAGMPQKTKAFWLAQSKTAAPLNPPNESTVNRLERELAQHRSLMTMQLGGATPAVLVIIALNALMFLAEVAFGGSTNTVALHRLGGLEPSLITVTGQYWRLLTALFLHYGALHLAVNLYALYILGPALESTIGSIRFAIAYLLSGLGSGAGVVLLARLNLTQADLLVGASGAVMGVVGTWAGFLIGHRHVPLARRRLINLTIIVVIQTVFDLYTPQVSMGAHLSGLVSGFFLGLILAPPEPTR